MITLEQILASKTSEDEYKSLIDLSSKVYDNIDCKDHKGLERRLYNDQIFFRLNSIAVFKELGEGNAEGFLKDMLYGNRTKYITRCDCCDQSITFHYNYESNSIEAEEDKECFTLPKRKKYSITTTSDKFIFLNDIRRVIKEDQTDYFNKYSINYVKGLEAVVREYASDNIINVFVGNTYVTFINKDGKLNLNTFSSDRDYQKDYQTVCCDLWWIGGIDLSQVDPEKLEEFKASGYNYVIVDVEPNTEYVLDAHYLDKDNDIYRLTHKFFKKVKK